MSFGAYFQKHCVSDCGKALKSLMVPQPSPSSSMSIQPSVLYAMWRYELTATPSVVQQLTCDTCMLSSFASAILFIATSETTIDWFQLADAILCVRAFRYYPHKFKQGCFDPLNDVTLFPTLVYLCSNDGGAGHTITIVGCLIFSSNAPTLLDLTLDSLNWCCSTLTEVGQFSHVQRALQFLYDLPCCTCTSDIKHYFLIIYFIHCFSYLWQTRIIHMLVALTNI